MADSISLAVLENLVHLNREDFPVGYVVIGAVIPDHVSVLLMDDLTHIKDSVPPHAIGDRWLEEQSSAVLCVPSVIVPQEYNVSAL